MRRDTVFCHLVHFRGADLDFKRDTIAANNRGVQRLVAVGLGRGNIVLKSSRNGLIQVMHIAQNVIAVGHGVYDDAHGADVVDFIHGLVLGVHLAINRVDMLDACRDIMTDTGLVELERDALLDVIEEILVSLGLLFQSVHNFLIANRVKDTQTQVFQLPLDAAHAQSVRDGRVDLHGFECLVALLALGQILESACIVQAVGQLDEDNADVLGHRHEHFTQIFKLLLLLGIAQHTQSGNAVYQLGNRSAELILNFAIAERGVLDAVVQQAGTDRVGIQPHLHDDFSHRDRMDDVGFAVAALLTFMRLCRALIGGTDLLDIGRGVLLFHPLDQKINPVFHRSAHNFDTSFILKSHCPASYCSPCSWIAGS